MDIGAGLIHSDPAMAFRQSEPRGAVMKPSIRSVFRFLVLLTAVTLLVTAGACSKDPSGPSFPFAGIWVGDWNDGPYSASFTLSVQEDGSASCTSNSITYSVEGTTAISALDIQSISVDSEGRLSGTGQWDGYLVGYGFIQLPGTVTGILRSGSGTGVGGLRVSFGGGTFTFTWELNKL
jgi:hypothetical protein